MNYTYMKGCALCMTLCLTSAALPGRANAESSAIVNEVLQSSVVKGVVKDSNGEPLLGVNVLVKGTTIGAVTDIDGNFSFEAPAGCTLVISYIGFESQEVKVKGNAPLNIILKEDSEALDEVVVVGYGVQKKSDVTGALSSVKGDDLTKLSISRTDQALQGQMAGVQITRSSGDPGSGATIRGRGITTLSTNDPLVIIDGVPGNLGDVAPENVKDIQVLKDAASAAIYGSRAAAGVVLVTTKRAKNKEFHLSYNGEYGIDKPTEVPEFANSVQWMTGLNEMTYNDGASSPYSIYSKEMIDNYAQLRAEDPDRYADTDFMGLGLKSHTSHHRHSLSLSGGTDKLKSNFNLGYYSSESLFKNKNYERINIRTNNDYSIN